MDNSSSRFPEVVDLNVGGDHLSVSLSTLTKYPSSKLAGMFSGLFEVPQDKDGRYFIDADSDLFRHLLAYIRFKTLPPDDKAVDVYTYARHFGIEDLCNRLLQWGPVLAHQLKYNRKLNLQGYNECRRQVKDALMAANFDNESFYVLFSDSSKHLISLCSVPGVTTGPGKQVISLKFNSSHTNRNTLMRFLLEDLKKIGVCLLSDNVFRPESGCECRLAKEFVMI